MEYTNNILLNNTKILNYIKNHNKLNNLLLNDPETKYNCPYFSVSKNFTHLHKLVTKTKKHPFLLDYLDLYLKSEGQETIDLKNETGYTALMLAISYSDIETVRLLIKHGANLNLQTDCGTTALILASKKKKCSIETLKLLIDNNVNLDLQDEYGDTALMEASNFEKSKLLIENKANLDLQDNEGRTVLMKCLFKSYCLDISKLLIKHNANLNLQDNKGRTALMILLKNYDNIGCFEIAKLLIEKANLDLQDNEGRTALMLVKNNINLTKLLIENKANLNLQDKYNETALMIYIFYDQDLEIIKLLINNNANLDLQDNYGDTALILGFNKESIVSLLLNSNTDIYIKNHNGFNIFTLAIFWGELTILDILIDHNFIISKDEIYEFVLEYNVETTTVDYLITRKYIIPDEKIFNKFTDSKYNIEE